MRYPQVLKYVGKLIFERGLNYYNKQTIEDFKINNNNIHAIVYGSLQNRYNVDILLNEKDEVIRAQCNCPYWSRCKHIAAVLIRYFDEKLGYKNNENNDLPSIPVNHKKDKTVFLNYENPPSMEVRYFCTDLEKHINIKKYVDGKQWNVVFKIKKQKLSFGEDSRFIITPGLQYIKKDGKKGNIYNYNERKIYECTDRENEILQRLLCCEGNKDDFFSYVNDFITYKDLQLFFIDQYKMIQVKIYKIQKTSLNFELAEIRNKDTFFHPLITFYGQNNVESSTHICPHYPVNSGVIFSVLSKEGQLFYCKNSTEYAYFITNILKKNNLYSPSDIQYLKTTAGKWLSGKVDIRFEAQSIKMMDVSPVPVISLKSWFGGIIDVHITFNYLGNEINVNKEDGFILHNQKGKNITVLRKNSIKERDILQSIADYLRNFFPESFYKSNPARYQIECNLDYFLTEIGPALIGKGFQLKIGKEKTIKKNAGRLRYGISSGIDWFNLDISFIDDQGNKVMADFTPEDLRQGIGKIGDSYLLLNREDCEKLKALLASCHKEKNSLRFSKLNIDIIEVLYKDEATIHNDEIDHIFSIFSKLQNIKTVPQYPLPEGLSTTLRNYQKAGYDWLHFLHQTELNGCLADDMGLGKTIQALSLLKKLKEENKLGLTLLIVPVTTFANWESEITRFTPGLRFIRHAGRKRAKNLEEYKGYDIILISYHTLRNDIQILTSHTYDYLILDESQSIKNAFSKTFKAMRIIKAKHKLSLTGTPVENNTLELWAQMDFLNPGILGSINEFKKRFSKPIEEIGDDKAANRLKKIVYPFILRRKKEDVIDDLPEKEIIYKYVEMNVVQKEAYIKVSRYYKEKVMATIQRKGIKRSSIEIIEALLRLRQMVLFPFLVSPEYAHINSSKFDLLKEMLDEILEEKHKVLIFSQFVQVLKQIEDHVKNNHIPYSYIDGSTKHRAKEIKRFQENKDIPVFLLSLKAGGLGINLTAADYVILFDPWWNPAIEKQAIDRTHRIGQKQKVIAFKIIVKDSIEEKILKLQNKKEDLINSIMMSEKKAFKTFDENEIIGLFDSENI